MLRLTASRLVFAGAALVALARTMSIMAALVVAASTFFALSGTAAAHERRNVGPYQFVVGWINEPAFAGQPNSLDLRISDPRVTPPKPVEGLEKTLKVQMLYGGLTNGFAPPITARFGTPGAYNAYVVPTKDGTYTFKITGKIDTLDVDQTFESSPTTFNDVQPISAVQYPEAVPSGADLNDKLNDIQSSLGQIRLMAIAAIVVSIVLPIGLRFGRFRTRMP